MNRDTPLSTQNSALSTSVPTRVSLLSIGDELLLGEIVDTNKPYIAQELLPLGMIVAGAETVGDEIDDIVAAFKRALARADVVIATGGLGPTDDDLTLEAVARTLGVEQQFYPEVMEQMAALLRRPITAFSESNKRQAMLPHGANVLRNDWGTAPGVHCKTGDDKHIFLMPGVPREMKGLLRERVLPLLAREFPAPRAVAIKLVHAFGIPESVIGERIKPLMQAGLNPNVGTRVKSGICTVRMVAHAPTLIAANALIAPVAASVRASLKEGLFGEDDETLAGSALSTLLQRKKTVAIAESCTGGLVAGALTDIPGASAALLEGAVVYSNAAKVRACGVKLETLQAHGAVSAQTAAELAGGIRERAGADIGLSITGIAGPDGGSAAKPVGLVFFGIATAAGTTTVEKVFSGLDRSALRERAVMQALFLLRKAALE